MLRSFLCVLCFLFALSLHDASAVTVTFEGLLANPNTFYNGDSGVGTNSDGWSDGGAFFNNTFTDFGGGFTAFSGWSYSNVANTTTPGFGNQYASSPGGGSGGPGVTNVGETYAIGFGDGAYFNLPSAMMVTSVDLTNTTYAALSMLNGDAFAKQFGGMTGNDPDFLQATLTGYAGQDASGAITGTETVDLADYTFVDNGNDFVLNTWRTVDLTSFGNAQSVGLTFASSDVGGFGINTPTYVALDNLTFQAIVAVPEPSSILVLSSLCAAVTVRRRRR